MLSHKNIKDEKEIKEKDEKRKKINSKEEEIKSKIKKVGEGEGGEEREGEIRDKDTPEIIINEEEFYEKEIEEVVSEQTTPVKGGPNRKVFEEGENETGMLTVDELNELERMSDYDGIGSDVDEEQEYKDEEELFVEDKNEEEEDDEEEEEEEEEDDGEVGIMKNNEIEEESKEESNNQNSEIPKIIVNGVEDEIDVEESQSIRDFSEKGIKSGEKTSLEVEELKKKLEESVNNNMKMYEQLKDNEKRLIRIENNNRKREEIELINKDQMEGENGILRNRIIELEKNLNEKDDVIKIQKKNHIELKEKKDLVKNEKKKYIDELNKLNIAYVNSRKDGEKKRFKIIVQQELQKVKERIEEDKELIEYLTLKRKEKEKLLKEKEINYKEMLQTAASANNNNSDGVIIEDYETFFPERNELLKELEESKAQIFTNQKKVTKLKESNEALRSQLNRIGEFINKTNSIGEGWLMYKQKKLFGKWEWCYFKCDKKEMTITKFKNPFSKKKKVYKLPKKKKVLCEEVLTKKKNSFTVLSNTDKEGKPFLFYFAAGNKEDMNKWLMFWNDESESIINQLTNTNVNDVEIININEKKREV